MPSQTMAIPTEVKECWDGSGLEVGSLKLIVSSIVIKLAFGLKVIRCEVLATQFSKGQLRGGAVPRVHRLTVNKC